VGLLLISTTVSGVEANCAERIFDFLRAGQVGFRRQPADALAIGQAGLHPANPLSSSRQSPAGQLAGIGGWTVVALMRRVSPSLTSFRQRDPAMGGLV
jgi:hypothetical protein